MLFSKGLGSNEKWEKVSYACRCFVFLFALATARACDLETCAQIGNLQGQLGNLTFHVFRRSKTQTQRATQLDVTQWDLSC